MKLARIHGPGDVRLDDVSEPTCGPDDVILDVGACGICGSDVGYAKLGGVAGPVREPMPIGHELAGTIASVGANCGAPFAARTCCMMRAIHSGGGFAPTGTATRTATRGT